MFPGWGSVPRERIPPQSTTEGIWTKPGARADPQRPAPGAVAIGSSGGGWLEPSTHGTIFFEWAEHLGGTARLDRMEGGGIGCRNKTGLTRGCPHSATLCVRRRGLLR